MIRTPIRSAFLTLASLAGLYGPAAAQGSAQHTPLPTAPDAATTPEARTLVSSGTEPFDGVAIDAPGDGSLWARGRNWKASFSPRGATFVPFFGSTSPRNFPIGFALESIRMGEHVLATVLDDGPATAGGDEIVIPRGAAREVYLLRPAELEQTFVFPSRLGHGELRVRMRVTSELAAAPLDGGGFRFTNEFGEVRYGRAEAYDARGARTAVASTLRDGVLELSVPAAFHDHAVFPLTIDPPILVFTGGTGARLQQFNADAAHLSTHGGVHAVVYEEIYSATDHDIFVRLFDLSGVPLRGGYIDFTTDAWVTPQIASNRAMSQFLVVAARGPIGGATYIWGRTADHALSGGSPSLTFGNQFAIQGFGTGMNPDVGGDPNPDAPLPANYCVTWEGQFTGEIYFNIVRTDSTLLSPNGSWLDPSQVFVSRPKISKSCGRGTVATREWVIVWQERFHPTDEDIFGTLIGYGGNVNVLSFPVDRAVFSDTNPEVSSKTDPVNGQERFLVTYERFYPGSATQPARTGLTAILFAGTTRLSNQSNLSALLQASSLRSQQQPCVDTDGVRFAVGYSEWSPLTGQPTAPYLATVHATPIDELAVSEYPVLVNAYAGPDDRMHITSERSGGASNDGYVAAWETTSFTGSSISVTACLYRGHNGLPPSAYFQNVLPGCGSLTLTATGVPALFNTFSLQLSGAQGLPFLMLGTPVAPVQICTACRFALDQATAQALFTTNYTLTVPPNAHLVGYALGAQGLDIFGAGGCTSPVSHTFSNAIVVTVL